MKSIKEIDTTCRGSAMKQGWEKKWIVLEDMKLSLYDSEDNGKENVQNILNVLQLNETLHQII